MSPEILIKRKIRIEKVNEKNKKIKEPRHRSKLLRWEKVRL